VWPKKKTYKAIHVFHTLIICFRRCDRIEIPRNCSDDNPQHHHRQILAPTSSGACTERHEMLLHLVELFGVIGKGRLEPAVGEECGWGWEDRGVSVHGPGLSRYNCSGRESVPHEVEGLVGGSVLGRDGGDDTFEEAWGRAMNTKAYRQEIEHSSEVIKPVRHRTLFDERIQVR
jgi:hypothetical protein